MFRFRFVLVLVPAVCFTASSVVLAHHLEVSDGGQVTSAGVGGGSVMPHVRREDGGGYGE